MINESEDKLLLKVSRQPYTIRFIENPSIAIQLAAIATNHLSLKYIKNPTDDILKYFELQRTKCPYSLILQHIEDPAENLQLAAIKDRIDNIKYIKNPSRKVKDFVLNFSLFNLTSINNLQNDITKIEFEKLLSNNYS